MTIAARILLSFGMMGAAAVAAPVTIEFGGVVDFVEPNLPISADVQAGMPFLGTYTFDPVGVFDAFPSDPSFGAYLFGSAGMMSVEIGNFQAESTDLGIRVDNVSIVDLYQVSNQSEFTAGTITWLSMMISLRDTSGSAFDSDELPLGAPDLDQFQFLQDFWLRQPNHRDPSISGTITSLTMIPEPSSLASLFVAAAMISLRRRRPTPRDGNNHAQVENHSTPVLRQS